MAKKHNSYPTGDFMGDFLNFLNTAELDMLTKTAGITRPIAGNIIAGRPFDSIDDCLHVRGMGKNLLARLKSDFEAGGNVSESRAMITVDEEASPVHIEKSKPVEESSNEGPSFLSRLGQAFVNFIRALFRLIALMLVIGGIGVGLYYGLPYLNNKLVVPVEKNTARIIELSKQVDALQAQLNTMDSKVNEINKTIATHSATIAQLTDIQSSLENQLNNGNEKLAQELKREIKVTRAVEFLSRARLYLSQSNFGLAKDDVQSARDLLAEVQKENPEYKAEGLKQVMMRLDLTLGNLPAFPVIAVGDMDIAMQFLMSSLPEGAAGIATTPSATLADTSTPGPNVEVTPTATP